MKNKEKQIFALSELMQADKNLAFKTNLIIGEGSLDSEIVIIGEAPGAKEDELKRPFVGRSGKLLDATLESIGLKREDVYITNIVKRRPPENRDPSPIEIAAYKPYLEKQLAIIKPKIIITLGRFSMNYFLSEAKIMRDQSCLFDFTDFKLMPIIHPAAAMRSKKNLEAFTEAFKKLKKELKSKK